MYRALNGVTRYALNEALNAVLRGKLGHTFFPSPVELRRLCDEAQRPHQEYERRVRLTEQQIRERQERAYARSLVTPEARARGLAKWAAVRASMGPDKETEPRPVLDLDLVAKVPDAPSTFKRVSAA